MLRSSVGPLPPLKLDPTAQGGKGGRRGSRLAHNLHGPFGGASKRGAGAAADGGGAGGGGGPQSHVHAALELREGVRLLHFGNVRFPPPPDPPAEWVLSLTLIHAHGLRKADLLGSSDPFVEAKCGGQKLSSTWRAKTLALLWKRDNESTRIGSLTITT